MNLQDLLGKLNDKPFKPFRIRICSGQYVDVRRSDRLILTQTLFIAGRRPNKQGIAMGGCKCNDLIHIAKITTLRARNPRGRRMRTA